MIVKKFCYFRNVSMSPCQSVIKASIHLIKKANKMLFERMFFCYLKACNLFEKFFGNFHESSLNYIQTDLEVPFSLL